MFNMQGWSSETCLVADIETVSISWLQAIVVALHALDDEETEPISTLELYTLTVPQDTIIKIPVEMTTMLIIWLLSCCCCFSKNECDFNLKNVVFLAKIVCYKILIHMQTFSLSSFMNHE